MSDRVTYVLEDGVATITMNDGKANILTQSMLEEIGAAFDRAQADGAIAVLRSSLPGIFAAGFDLKVFASGDAKAAHGMVKTGADLALRLQSFPEPIVGVVEGHAYPMGLFLLLGCDVRIGTEGNYLMGLNEVAIGISPPSFAIELARSRMHPAWLNKAVTTGKLVAAPDAVTAGLLDEMVAPEALEATLDDTLAHLKTIDRSAHIEAKHRLRARLIDTVQETIDREQTLAIYQALVAKVAA